MSRSTASLVSGSGESSFPEKPIEKKQASDGEKPKPGLPTGPPRKGPGFNPDLYKPKTAKFWLILLSNFLALFLVALDRTIISTAIPRITDNFKSLGDIGWYGSAYMLTTSASQLLYGRVYKFYDMKWTFMIAIIIFEVGSAICGAAPNSPVFIVGRSIAGLGSAGIFAGGMMIMIPMIPLHKRPMFQGMFGMVFGIASVLGPVVGGAFTGHVSWRWCFYINLPVGAITMVFLVFFWNPPTQRHQPASIVTHIKRLDPLGTFFFLPGIVSLLLALQWGGSTYAWSNGRIIALFIVFGVLIAAFAAVQILKPETATVPPKVITQRSILCGALFTFFLAGAMLMTVYFVPIWFQTVKGVDPLKSGTYTLPLVLSLVASSMLSGLCTQKIGYYVPSMLLSPCLMATGEGLMSTFNPQTGSSHWIGFQFITGFGLGLGMQTSGLAAQTVLPPEDVSTGISIMFFVQQLGGAVFTTVGQTILSNLLVSKLASVPGLDASAIVTNGATELLEVVPAQYMDFVIHAYNFACTRIFLAGMGLSLGSLAAALGMEWKNIKKGKNGPPGGPKDAEAAGGEAGPAGPPAEASAQDKETGIVTKEASEPEQAKKNVSDE